MFIYDILELIILSNCKNKISALIEGILDIIRQILINELKFITTNLTKDEKIIGY